MDPRDQEDIEDDADRAAALFKMTQIDSRVVKNVMDIIVSALNGMSINSVVSGSFGGSGKTSFYFMSKLHVIQVSHQSHSGAALEFFTNGKSHAQPILWSPMWPHWVIIYLIAGYFRIPAGVMLLHRKTTTFCEYVSRHGTTCRICGFGKKLNGRHDGDSLIPKNRFRLIMLHPDNREDPDTRENAARVGRFGLDNFGRRGLIRLR